MASILCDIASEDLVEIVKEFCDEGATNLAPMPMGVLPLPTDPKQSGVYLQPDGAWTVIALLPDPDLGGGPAAPTPPTPAPIPPGPDIDIAGVDPLLNIESPTKFTIFTNLKTTVSALTAELVDFYFQMMKANHNTLTGIGQPVMDAARKYGINATYIVAHAIVESGWGTSRLSSPPRNNLFGWNAFDSNPDLAKGFKDRAECIDFVMGRVNKLYLDKAGAFYVGGAYVGNKQSGMNVHYAAEADWGATIASVAQKMGQRLDAAIASGAVNGAPPPAPIPEGTKVRGSRAEYVVDHTIAGSSLRIPSGMLSIFGDDGTLVTSIPANTGGFVMRFQDHNGPIPPGTYRILNYRSPRNDEGSAMRAFDVSFSFSLDPLAGTNVGTRDGLDIHPDGPPPGTHGCIGLVASTRQQLEDVRDVLRSHTSNGSHLNVTVTYKATSGVV